MFFPFASVLRGRSGVTLMVRPCVVGYGCELFGNLDQSVEKLRSHVHPASWQYDIVLGNLQTTCRLGTIQRNRSETSHLHSRLLKFLVTSLDLSCMHCTPPSPWNSEGDVPSLFGLPEHATKVASPMPVGVFRLPWVEKSRRIA